MSTYTELNKEALFQAYGAGNIKTFISLISECPEIERKSFINIQNKYGDTPLSRAVVTGKTEIVKSLLAMPGIDMNVQSKYGEERMELDAAKSIEAAHSEDSKLNEDVEAKVPGDFVE